MVEFCPPSIFAEFVKDERVVIDRSFKGEMIWNSLMRRYDVFCSSDFIREEEFREKIMILCRHKGFSKRGPEDGIENILTWACEKKYEKMVKSLLTLPNCNKSNLSEESTKWLETLS